MLYNRFKVKHKETGEISQVYDIKYLENLRINTLFLVYMSDAFMLVPAEDCEPYVEDLHKGSLRNKSLENYTFEDGM
jgi:hypothetical protein